MYLELARLLNADLNSCIVFEESISGVRAAVTAQIKGKEILGQYGT
jgi:beta-phosphoglucomutase-like phosphatase (HAD superfamily)